MTWWHYTCTHGHEKIVDEVLAAARLPHTRFTDEGPWDLAWFTDLANPVRDALGLTSRFTACDRTRYRYRVIDPAPLIPWVKVRRRYRWARAVERSPGARPRHWWVSTGPVRVVYDPVNAPTSYDDIADG